MPVRWSAQECLLPAETAVASVMLRTCTGTEESAFPFLPLCPLPSRPKSLLPQQYMVPPRWSAQECLLPAETAVALFAGIVVGGGGSVVGGGGAVVGGWVGGGAVDGGGAVCAAAVGGAVVGGGDVVGAAVVGGGAAVVVVVVVVVGAEVVVVVGGVVVGGAVTGAASVVSAVVVGSSVVGAAAVSAIAVVVVLASAVVVVSSARAGGKLITATGTAKLLFVPSPSCPSLLLPQQDMVPACKSAQECALPAAMAAASAMRLTRTGNVVWFVVPLPS